MDASLNPEHVPHDIRQNPILHGQEYFLFHRYVYSFICMGICNYIIKMVIIDISDHAL